MPETVQRECIEGPDISGSTHHYGHVEWMYPDQLYDDDYARPICPVSQLGCVDRPADCRRIAERVTDEEGRGAWFCGWHGVFRVFGYPRNQAESTEQQSLMEAI